MTTFELGAGYDEDPVLVGLDHDGNMDRFHIHIIGIHALILFCTPLSLRHLREPLPITVPFVLLFILLFLITPQCTGLDLASGGRLSCEMGEGSYAIGAVLVGLAGYTGYQLCRLLFPARFG
jgi:hypothetical protein